MTASYSIAYLQDGRDPEHGSILHWYVWAAWLDEPTGRPWTTPIATGRVLHMGYSQGVSHADEHAEVEADDAIRARLGTSVETRRLDDSFARAAYREAKGGAPNWRPKRQTRTKYATPRGFSRAPGVPARAFFAAAWAADEAKAREVEELLRRADWARSGHGFDWMRGQVQASPALATLGLSPGATAADVRRAYRRFALTTHPDRGGSAEAFRRITEAKDEALRAVGGR
ncbi:DnaJ domain-containing protein [Sorangium sp. So ce134]